MAGITSLSSMSPAGGQQTPPEALVDHATCLGCGCACDDIAVRVADGRITAATNACGLGTAWFGDGVVPSAIRIDGRDAAIGRGGQSHCSAPFFHT